MLYLSLIRPIAIYSSETWALTWALEQEVSVAEMQWIRRYAHVSLRQEYTNVDVRRRAHCPITMSEACRQSRLRYYGHVCRMDPKRAPRWILHHDVPGKRKQGRPQNSWLRVLELDAATRGLSRLDLHRLAPDRAAYRHHVVYAARLDGQATCPENLAAHHASNRSPRHEEGPLAPPGLSPDPDRSAMP